MKTKINRKRFFLASLVLIPVILLADIIFDAVKRTLDWNEVFSTENLFWKISAAFVLAYFYSTMGPLGKNEKE
ncbi:MAG: hypothetical protein KGO81_08760 [Bacteroidota bacterium]|nr:hypothetical protein [Bacteroidota bacterium]